MSLIWVFAGRASLFVGLVVCWLIFFSENHLLGRKTNLWLKKKNQNVVFCKVTWLNGAKIMWLFHCCLFLFQNRYGFLEESIQIRQPNQYITKYGVRMGDELVLAPLSLFFPDMYGISGPHLARVQQRFDGDPADPHDDFYLRQVQRGQDPVSSLIIWYMTTECSPYV